ncbi:MAG: hypothetical protein IJW38_01960 [Clostridia bacterium]|nr:hypothetical protein [Clostridia bacterium]
MNKLIVGRNYSLFLFTADMKYSLISVMGYRFGIFPFSAATELELTGIDFEPIFLSPSLKCDFEMLLPKQKTEDKFYEILALFALPVYFFKVRGLPEQELVISHSVSNFTIKNTDKIALNMSKCKYTFTNYECEIKGAYIKYYLAESLAVFSCENVSFFDKDVLPAALLNTENNASTAVAYSFLEHAVFLKKWGRASFVECAVAVFSHLIFEGFLNKNAELNFNFDSGEIIKLKFLGNGILEFELQNEFLGFYEY